MTDVSEYGNDFLLDQIGSLYWAAAISAMQRGDWVERQGYLALAQRYKAEDTPPSNTTST